MISLHDVYERGNEAVKEAVRAFGSRHPLALAASDAAPDWKAAERHFTHLIEVIMGTATPAADAAATIRRAENEVVQLLLALHTVPHYRCPICVKQGPQ